VSFVYWSSLTRLLILERNHSKTQIALEYAYRYQEKTGCSIFWVRSDNEANFTKNYSDIARLANLSPELKGVDLLYAVKRWIEEQRRWLIVFDNADNLNIFKPARASHQLHEDKTPSPELLQFVPNTSNGTAIWASRDGSILGRLVGVNEGVEVGKMTFQESLRLFQNLSGRPVTDTASESEKELLNHLEMLPLAISQASAYIRKTTVSTQLYVRAFTESEERQANLLSTEFDEIHRSDVPNSVMHTWLISMKQIAEESECGERILNTIAFLDNQNIPFELLSAAVGAAYSEDQVLLAAARLVEYSFLQRQKAINNELPVYGQHRLVRLAARKALAPEKSHFYSRKALNVMIDVFPSGAHETWRTCKLYLPHSLKAVEWREAEGYCDLAPILLTRMGRYYWEQGQSDEAEGLDIQVLELRKTVLGEEHPDTVQAMANLALTWWQQGRSDAAEELQAQVLELRKAVLGEKHPDTITAMANLTSTWWQQGRSDAAEELEIQVLELSKAVLGEKHLDTITAMANLASTWQQQGRSDVAEELKVQVLELRKAVLGEKHPDTITAMANLALTWWQQGRSDAAEELEVQVLELSKTVLGEKHPDTIRATANLASTWRQQGRSDVAEELEVQVLELRKAVLGEKHPDTITAMANLASAWWQQGRSDVAEELEIQVLGLSKAVLGEKHPDTITAMANLASTWGQQGRSDAAEGLQIQVLELQKAVLGEKHPDTITAMANLASTWWQQGRSDAAEELEIQVLELSKAVLGEKHPDTITAMENLALTWRQQGRLDAAEGLQIQVIELQRAVLGEEHPDTIMAMANLQSIRKDRTSHDDVVHPKSDSSNSKPRKQTLSLHNRLASFVPRNRFKNSKGRT
jgi:tetratricopeptide (TPR) repeat protein